MFYIFFIHPLVHSQWMFYIFTSIVILNSTSKVPKILEANFGSIRGKVQIFMCSLMCLISWQQFSNSNAIILSKYSWQMTFRHFRPDFTNSKLIIDRQAKDLRMLKNLFQMKQNGELQAKRHRRGVYWNKEKCYDFANLQVANLQTRAFSPMERSGN